VDQGGGGLATHGYFRRRTPGGIRKDETGPAFLSGCLIRINDPETRFD